MESTNPAGTQGRSTDHIMEQHGGSEGSNHSAAPGGCKKLIIIRGLPGSGKTTLARSLVGTNGIICSTDDFFVINGMYTFDISKLEENHRKNQSKAQDAMESERTPIIIDNTNTKAWEMKPYVLLARKYSYSVEILEPETPWKFDIDKLARYNSHGVSPGALKKMRQRYDHDVTMDTILESQKPDF